MNWTYGDEIASYDLKLFKAKLIEAIHPIESTKETVLKLEGQDSCNILLICEDKVCLVEQYRFGTDGCELELPGGLIENLEAPEESILRELKEETGIILDSVESLGVIPSNPVYLNCYIHHYMAVIHSIDYGPTRFDPGEFIELRWVPLKDIRTMISKGVLRHPHTLSAIFLAFLQGKIDL